MQLLHTAQRRDGLRPHGTTILTACAAASCLAAGAHAADFVNLRSAADYCVIGLDGARIRMKGEDTLVNGNLAVGPLGQTDFESGTIAGICAADGTALAADLGGVAAAGMEFRDLMPVADDVMAVIAIAAALEPTETFDMIHHDTVIAGNGNINVIEVDRILLTSDRMLTLAGTEDDVFIINVTQFVRMNHNAVGIILDGVLPEHVLFNVMGGGNAIDLAMNTAAAGTFIALNGQASIDGGLVDGAVIAGGDITLDKGSVIEGNPFQCTLCDLAPLAGVQMKRGKVLDADLARAAESDDVALLLRSTRKPADSKRHLDARLTLLSPMPLATRMDMTLELSATVGGVKAKLMLWNWTTAAWDQIEAFILPETDAVKSYVRIPEADRYIRNTDGSIRVRLSGKVVSARAPRGFEVRIDQLEVAIGP
jgi:hypothetical protein